MIKAIRKLAKWYRKTEEATTRKQAQKALRKVSKWARRLAEYTTEVADERRRKSFCARSRSWTGPRGKAARRKWKCADD